MSSEILTFKESRTDGSPSPKVTKNPKLVAKLTIRLEIRPDNSNPVTGYDNVFGFDTRTCLSADLMKQANLPPAAMDRFRKETSPVSTAMKGTATEGSIVFAIDKTLGSAPTQCPMMAYTVSLFGSDAIAAQWKQGACPDGQAVLARVGEVRHEEL